MRNRGLANSGGYPTLTRNVAISNGAECGIFQNFNPGDDLLRFDTNGSLGDFLDSATGFILGASAGNAGLIGAGFVSLIPGNGKFRANFNAKSIPYGTGNNIYKGRISYQKKLFSAFGWAPTITVNITNVEKNQPSNVLPFDTYGGGRYDTSALTGEVDLPDEVYIRDGFSFIPTASALDIGKGITTLNDNDYKMAYVGATPPIAPKNSPFENFITDYDNNNPNASNSVHISFNPRNGLWLARELTENSITSNCSFLCDGTTIAGAPILCGTSTYTVPPGAPSYTWSINGSAATITSNGNTATVTRTGQQNGSVTLTVVINGGDCGTVTLAKQVWVGVPKFNSLIPIGNQNGYSPEEPSVSIGMNGEGCNQIRMKVLFDADALLEYQWEKFTTDVAWSVNTSSGNILISPQCNTNFSFRVRVRNSCGWSAWQQFEFPLTRCTIACDIPADPSPIVGANFLVSPNPVTSGLVTIGVKADAPWFLIPETNDPLNPSHNTGGNQLLERIRVNMSIFNSLGILVQQYTNLLVHPTPAQINISNLPSGSYIIIFEYFGQTESYTIIKS